MRKTLPLQKSIPSAERLATVEGKYIIQQKYDKRRKYCTIVQNFFCAFVRKKMKTEKTRKVIAQLSGILLDEMGKEEYTIAEMAKKCGISERKLCDIIYKKDKGLMLETLMDICENAEIKYSEIFP